MDADDETDKVNECTNNKQTSIPPSKHSGVIIGVFYLTSWQLYEYTIDQLIPKSILIPVHNLRQMRRKCFTDSSSSLSPLVSSYRAQ